MPCKGGLRAGPGPRAGPPYAPLPRRFRLLRIGGSHHDPIDEEAKTWELTRPFDGPLAASAGSIRRLLTPSPMSRRGLSSRGLPHPRFRPPRPIARSDVAEMPTSLWAVSLSVTGASPFTRVLANPAPTSLFSGHFTFETAPVRPTGRRPKSLYTGMTAHPAHFRPLPQRGGRVRHPKCGMVSRLIAPHTRWQSDRQ